jgi:hypothetical protein
MKSKEVKMANEKHSASLVIREMPIITTPRFRLIPVRMVVIRKTKTNVSEDTRKRNLTHYWQKCKLVQSLRKSL